jgi:hypothetical protein
MDKGNCCLNTVLVEMLGIVVVIPNAVIA